MRNTYLAKAAYSYEIAILQTDRVSVLFFGYAAFWLVLPRGAFGETWTRLGG